MARGVRYHCGECPSPYPFKDRRSLQKHQSQKHPVEEGGLHPATELEPFQEPQQLELDSDHEIEAREKRIKLEEDTQDKISLDEELRALVESLPGVPDADLEATAQVAFAYVQERMDSAVNLVGDDPVGNALQGVEGLLVHSTTIVERIRLVEGCRLGGVPSLSDLVPPLVAATLRCVQGAMKNQALRGAAGRLLECAKTFWRTFLDVVTEMPVDTAVGDELDLLARLCNNLAALHGVLLLSSFTMCVATWRAYIHLVEDHQRVLCERLDLGAAIEILAGAAGAGVSISHY